MQVKLWQARARRGRTVPVWGAATVCLALLAFAAPASAYVDGGTVAGIRGVVAAGPGVQTDPKVSGSLISYTAAPNDGGNGQINYFDVATGTYGVIPAAVAAHELRSDVSGSRIVYTRQSDAGQEIVVYDRSTGVSSVVAPTAETARANPAIGGSTVVAEDFTLGTRLIGVFDLSAGTTTTFGVSGAQNFSPAISPNGDVVVWVACTAGACTIEEARKTATGWSRRSLGAGDQNPGPATDGTSVAYARGGAINWQAVGGGTEGSLAVALGFWPLQISNGAIVFEQLAADGYSDVSLYDTKTDTLSVVSNTPQVAEQLSDISTRSDGSQVIAWTSWDNATQATTSLDVHYLVTPPDVDLDGVVDADDNCSAVANSGQADADGDGIGDVCDPTVRGIGGQIADLIDHTLAALDRPALAPTLKSRLEAALASYAAGNKAATCAALAAYGVAVQLAPSTAFSAAEKAQLIAESQSIRAALGC